MKEGCLHLYFGPMFSGKTETLIKEYGKYKVLEKNVLVINHSSDSRYSNKEAVISHNQMSIDAVKLNRLEDADLTDVEVILIDEAQFFNNLYSFCVSSINKGLTIIVFGLDGTFDQKSFGSILDLIPLADIAIKLTAYCKECKDGTPAPFTKRKDASNKSKVLVGTTDIYEAVCRRHL